MYTHSQVLNEQIAYGYRLATGRTASNRTIALLRGYYDKELARYSEDSQAAQDLLKIGEYKTYTSIPVETQAALTLLSNLLLNLDATITRG